MWQSYPYLQVQHPFYCGGGLFSGTSLPSLGKQASGKGLVTLFLFNSVHLVSTKDIKPTALNARALVHNNKEVVTWAVAPMPVFLYLTTCAQHFRRIFHSLLAFLWKRLVNLKFGDGFSALRSVY